MAPPLTRRSLLWPGEQVAAACTFIALYTLNRTAWTATLQHYTRYSAMDLRTCALQVHEAFLGTSQSALPAIREKYNNPKLKSVSSLAAHKTLPAYLFEMTF